MKKTKWVSLLWSSLQSENMLQFISESLYTCVYSIDAYLFPDSVIIVMCSTKEKINTAKIRGLFECLPAMDSDISFFRKILMMSCCFSFCWEKVGDELLWSWFYVAVVVRIFVVQLSRSFGHSFSGSLKIYYWHVLLFLLRPTLFPLALRLNKSCRRVGSRW